MVNVFCHEGKRNYLHYFCGGKWQAMRVLVMACRIILAGIFFVSGMTKLNDPVGFSYKMEEYFSKEVLNMPFLTPLALELGIFISGLEVFLAYCLLFWRFMKVARWIIFLLLLYFTALTFYTAYFEKVKECGCFGDALILSPWTTFWKDVFFLAVSLPLVLIPWKVLNGVERTFTREFVVFFLTLLFVFLFSWLLLKGFFFIPGYFLFTCVALATFHLFFAIKRWFMLPLFAFFAVFPGIYVVWYHLPLKEYLPYRRGASIPELMSIPPGAPTDSYAVFLYYQNIKTGEVKKFTPKDAPWKDSLTWKWVKTEQELVRKGYTPPITDFVVADTSGNDITETILSDSIAMWIISQDLEKTHREAYKKIARIVNELKEDGVKAYFFTPESPRTMATFLGETGLQAIPCIVDQVVLKTMMRSNPGIMLVRKGRIIEKWHFRRLPSSKRIRKILQSS